MDERHLAILGGLIRHYIKEAQPLGSQTLARALNLGLSPATIRAILHDLDQAGYLEQPHKSAGRFPTDKGYRYYVDRLEAQQLQQQERDDIKRELGELQDEYQQLARATSKLLSRLSHAIAISGFVESRQIQEAGLQELLQQPGGEAMETVKEISTVLDQADEYVDQLAQNEESTDVYIGHENPFFPAQHTSLIVKTIQAAGQEKIVLLIVGPKRMQYQRNMSILDSFASIVKENYL